MSKALKIKENCCKIMKTLENFLEFNLISKKIGDANV